MKLFLILQNLHQILLHSKVDFTVAVEGAGTFGVAGERRDKVGVFDLPIDIPLEGAAGKVAAGNFVQRVLDLRAGSIPARGTSKTQSPKYQVVAFYHYRLFMPFFEKCFSNVTLV